MRYFAFALVLTTFPQMLSGGQHVVASEGRLEPQRLFSLLNLDTPGMEKVKVAADAGDFNRAEAELLDYMRNRKNVRTVIPWRTAIPWKTRMIPWRKRLEYKGRYASEEDMAIADDALEHIFGGHPGDWTLLFPAQQFGKDIDWKSKAVKDKEWIWHFNMMPYWKPLSRAYWHTGDEKYAQEFFREIDDWIAKNPPDGNNTTWRRLDAGVRAGWFWPVAYFHCLTSPSLTPRTHSRILLGFHEHAVFLNSRNFNRGNWGIYEARGVFFVSVLFPELKDTNAWRDNALRHLTKQILKEVGPDGGYIEKCPHYHIDCIHIFQSVLDLARLNDIKVPESYAKSVEKMYEFIMFTSLPDGTAPRIGDSWLEPVREILADGAKRFNREDMEFVATEGAKGTVPEETSVCMEYSGFSVMRDGWDEKSQYLLMKWKDGAWHSHFDDLSIILAAGGRTLLDDSSTIDYFGGGKPKSNATCSHSTIAIAGKNRPSRLKQTKLNQWLRGADMDYVDASGPATNDGHTHRRRIAYVRGKYWVMIDDVRGEKKGTDQVDMYFQFAPSEVRVDGLTARTDFKEGSNLMVKVMEIPGLTAQQEEGWIAVKYKVVKSRPRIRFSVKRLPIRLVSLLYPYEGKAPDIGMQRLTLSEDAEKKGVFGLQLRTNSEKDLIFFAPERCDFIYQGASLNGPVAHIQIQPHN